MGDIITRDKITSNIKDTFYYARQKRQSATLYYAQQKCTRQITIAPVDSKLEAYKCMIRGSNPTPGTGRERKKSKQESGIEI